MKQVLVTGGAGFIGSHLTEALLARGDRVTAIDDESTGNAKNLDAARQHERLTYIQGSVGDEQIVRELTAGVDEVYHLAAAVGVALIARAPMETIERNIFPTELILSCLRERIQRGEKVKCFLASTSEVYGKNPKAIWAEEDDLVFGSTTRARWSYGASKAIDEFMGLASHREYGLPVVIGRFFNVVGPRQTGAYGMVLPRFVDAALSGQPLIVHDDGKQTRCFAHVNDVVRAVVTLMETDAAVGRVFNIGSDQPISIIELAQRVVELSDSSSAIEFQTYAEAYDEDFEDIRRRVPDLTRLKNTIGHQPKHDLADMIRQVIDSKRSSDE
ncbi:MAG: GDP-mannose 4,6-dehydratase [Planctomycetota bacterium]